MALPVPLRCSAFFRQSQGAALKNTSIYTISRRSVSRNTEIYIRFCVLIPPRGSKNGASGPTPCSPVRTGTPDAAAKDPVLVQIDPFAPRLQRICQGWARNVLSAKNIYTPPSVRKTDEAGPFVPGVWFSYRSAQCSRSPALVPGCCSCGPPISGMCVFHSIL